MKPKTQAMPLRLMRTVFALSAAFCATILMLWVLSDKPQSSVAALDIIAVPELNQQSFSLQLDLLTPASSESVPVNRAMWF